MYNKNHKIAVSDNSTYTLTTTHYTMFNWESQRGDKVNPESRKDDRKEGDDYYDAKNEKPFHLISVEFPSFHNDTSTESGLQDVDSTISYDIVNNDDVDQHDDDDMINDTTKIQHNKTVMSPTSVSKAEKEKEARRRVSWHAEESDLPEARRRASWHSVSSLGNILKGSN